MDHSTLKHKQKPLPLSLNFEAIDECAISDICQLRSVPAVLIAGEPGSGKSDLIEACSDLVTEVKKTPTRKRRSNESGSNPLTLDQIIELDTPRLEGNPLPGDSSMKDWELLAEYFGIELKDIENNPLEIGLEHLTIYEFWRLNKLSNKILKSGKIPIWQISPLHLEFFCKFFKKRVAFRILTHPEVRIERLKERYAKAANKSDVAIRESRMLLSLTSGILPRQKGSTQDLIEMWNDSRTDQMKCIAIIHSKVISCLIEPHVLSRCA